MRHRYLRGDHSGALLLYMRAAAMGIEVGQLNAAWLLSRFIPHPSMQHVSMALGPTNTWVSDGSPSFGCIVCSQRARARFGRVMAAASALCCGGGRA